MNLSISGLLEHARTEEGKKQLRYAGVAGVFVPVGQVMMYVLNWTTHLSFPILVLVTACILTVPNYFANKVYVWRDTNRENLRTQILVFWVAALLGTGFAMLLAAIAERLFGGSGGLLEVLGLFGSQVLGYGLVWVARFLFLDRWLFKATHHQQEPSSDELSELHSEFPI